MDLKQRNIIALITVVVLVAVAWWLFWPPSAKITQGLDLRGGLSVILTAQETSGTPVTGADMDRAELIVRNRVDKLGAAEPVIQRQGTTSILVQLPGVKNAEEAIKVLGSTGKLEFVDVASITDTATAAQLAGAKAKGVQLKPGTYKALITGASITNAAVQSDQKTGQLAVTVDFDAAATKTWAEYTAANVGKQVAIVLDGTVQSAPQIQSPIPDGKTEITGNFTPDEAKNLRTVLETGALPVALEFSESRVVGPTLGQDSLRQGVFAALLGVAIIAVYLLVFYRGLGLTAVGALFVFGSLFLGTLAGLSMLKAFTLTLPGIAGIVLTMGLAADSSILVMERYKEEIRDGKTYRSAASSGTWHGIMTSLDADLVTFVSALVLFMVAIGPVKGFALTLMIGIAFDIVTMFMYKRPIIMLLADKVIPSAPWFWGVPPQEVTATKGKKPVAKGKGGAARA